MTNPAARFVGPAMRFVCELGGAPRLVVADGVELTIEDWAALSRLITERWLELQIRCTCSHPFRAHLGTSPHGCCALTSEGCACRTFTAAEPLYERIDR